MGIVAGMQRAGVDPTLVWFDAHGDVQTPGTSASGYLGGMPVRQLVGGSDRTVPERLGLRDVAERDVLLVGVRDLDPPEAGFLLRAVLASGRVVAVGVACTWGVGGAEQVLAPLVRDIHWQVDREGDPRRSAAALRDVRRRARSRDHETRAWE